MEMIKASKTQILKWWENYANGKITGELKKTANEDVNEIVWELSVSGRRSTMCRVC
jgi:hypothetical protein